MWFVIKFFDNGARVRGVWSRPNLDSFSFDPKYLSNHYSYTLLNFTKRKPLSIPIGLNVTRNLLIEIVQRKITSKFGSISGV